MRLRPLLLLALLAAAIHIDAFTRDTTIDMPSFSIVLPGSWQQHAERDGMRFTRDPDTLYVTTMELQEPLSRGDLKSRVHRIADMRQKLIGDLSRGRATMSPVENASDADRVVSYFSGEDPQTGQRLYVAVVGLPKVIVTTAIYRPLTAPPSGFSGLGARVMGSVRESPTRLRLP